MTLTASTTASRLIDISGAANVIGDPAPLAGYEIDGMIPGAAVIPGSREEICEIVKFCAAERLAIVPCGGRSKLSMGSPPKKYEIALDLARSDRIAAYDPGDLTLSVEPGIPLQRVAGVLAGHRQFLPLAIPFLSCTTAGGAIASGVHSPLRQAYGTARDFLLGLEYVTGEGTLAKSGATVVKNVAGYDLHKLMIGAMGTLGVITKINFRTFPMPASTRVVASCCDKAEGVLGLRSRVMQSPLRPLTMEVLSPGAVEMLSSAIAARIASGPEAVDRLPKNKWAFLATFSGSGAVLERYESELRQMAEAAACESHEIFGDEKNPATFARLREFIPIALQSSPATVIVKISVLPSKVGALLEATAETSQKFQLRWTAMAGGLGVGYVALLPNACDEDARMQAQKATDQILETCARLGGNAMIPWRPADWKRSLNIWGPARSDFEQMRKIKSVFDPAGILAPGRFAGGI